MNESEENADIIVQDLNVVSDEAMIYQGGKLTPVNVDDLLYNKVALSQLINDYIIEKRTNERNKRVIDKLQLEQAGHKLQPYVLVVNAITNILGAILVGIGTNFITSDQPPEGAQFVLIIGAILSIVTAVSPIILPIIITHRTERAKNADKE